MTTLSAHKSSTGKAQSGRKDFSDSDVAAVRLQNFINELAEGVRSGTTPVAAKSMAETDALFTVDVILEFMKNRAVNAMTKEKKRQQRRLHSKALFLQMLENDGGVYSSAEAADQIGKSKVTVKSWKDNGRLLALEIDGEFCYPVFQFTEEENISDKGVLRGIADLLPEIKEFSDRMQYSFFMEERNTVLNGLNPAGQPFTVAGVLRMGPNKELVKELHRLARNYGRQEPL